MTAPVSRRTFLGTAAVTLTAGCTSLRGDTSNQGVSPPVAERSVDLPYELSDVFDAAVVGTYDGDASLPSVGRFDPSIDKPRFVTPMEADDVLDAGTPVFGLEIDGDARAYPQPILVWHEIVNDTVGGVNVSVTYCPLTGSVLAYGRGSTSFGQSNKLVNGNLILYDRGTETWWPQILGTGIAGEHRGDSLEEYRVVWTSWDRWRTAHPETRVLSRETGYTRDYDDDIYGSYDPPSGYYALGPPAMKLMYDDGRFHPKTVVIGTRGAGGAAAVTKERLRDERSVAIDAARTRYAVFYDEKLDTGYAYDNPNRASFTYESGGGGNGGYVDQNGTSRAADSIPLEPVNAFDVMWFAWAAFYPRTAVVPESGE